MRPIAQVNGQRHAITDLYDEQRRTFLVQYPVWFVTALSLAGVVAFAVTGFLGYTAVNAARTNALDPAFQQPWLLFLWFCALLVTLQVSIFRNSSLRRRLIATLIISAVAIVFIGITYFSNSLPEFLRQLLQGGRFFRFLATNPYSYTVLNFLLIAVFWVDTFRRWIRRARGLPPNPRVDLGFDGSAPGSEDMPTLQELISGDLIAGAVFVLFLAFIFQAGIVGTFIHPRGAGPITTCMVSWPLGACVHGGGMTDAPTLSFIDLIQALVYLPLGLIILALSATLSGLGAVGGVDDKALEAELLATASSDESSTVPIAVDVTQTLINTLKSALDRRLRLLLSNLVLSLRMIGWPALIFLATYGLAQLSTNVQLYLHSARTPYELLVYVLPAIGWGLLALLGVVFSAALMLFRWRVAENTLRFLGLIGFVLLLTFWLFSLALYALNQLLFQTHALDRHPFDPPSSPTYISAAALLIFGSLLLIRRMRGPRVQPAATLSLKTPVAVGAAVAAHPAGAPDPNATQATPGAAGGSTPPPTPSSSEHS